MRSYRIEIYRSLSDSVQARWRSLELRADLTAFQALAWTGPWYDVFCAGGRAEPLIVLVSDATTRRDLLLLPLCRRRAGTLTAIEFADLGLSDYNAPIIAADAALGPDEMPEIWDLIEPELPGHDLIRLEKLPLDVGARPNPLLGLAGLGRMSFDAHATVLPEDFASFAPAALSLNMRSKLRRLHNKIARIGPLELVIARDARTADELFATLLAQRRMRCQEIGRPDVLEDPLVAQFYRRVLLDGLHSGHCTIAGLKIAGELVATTLGLRQGATYAMLLPSIAGGRWNAYSLGTIMFYRHMQALHEEGVRSYDFTIGDEPYKKAFGATAMPLMIVLRSRTLRSYGHVAMQNLRALARRNPALSAPLVSLYGSAKRLGLWSKA